MTAFTEKQQFRQWWLWTIIIVTCIAPVIISFYDARLGYKSHSVNNIMVGAIVPALVIILFLIMQLRTRIDETGIYYRFFPIHFQVLRIGWDEIANIYVRQYSPLKEYGGWGIRYGFGGKGKAYNVSGSWGLQIVLKTGKKILIGSQKSDELASLLDDLVKSKVITRKVIQPED